MLTTDDRLAIHELLARYMFCVDDRRFSLLPDLFTADAVYDMTDFEMGVVHGPEAIAALWSGPLAAHPLAHHSSDVVITATSADRADVRSKGLGIGANGRVGSSTYSDIVVRTPEGWKFAARAAVLRRTDTIPAIT